MGSFITCRTFGVNCIRHGSLSSHSGDSKKYNSYMAVKNWNVLIKKPVVIKILCLHMFSSMLVSFMTKNISVDYFVRFILMLESTKL